MTFFFSILKTYLKDMHIPGIVLISTCQWSVRPKEVEPTLEEDMAPKGPLSEYELAREERIVELAVEFQRVFGRPLKCDAGLIKLGILEQVEAGLEETELEEEVVWEEEAVERVR